MALTRIRQIAATVESAEGAGGAPTAADVRVQVEDLKITREIAMAERAHVLRSLGSSGSVPGKRAAGVAFSTKLKGSGTASTAPAFGRYLKACGWKEEVISKFTIGAITSGPLLHGETVTQTGTGATGRVVKDAITGTATLYVVRTGVAVFNGTGLLTGGESGATTTPSALTASYGKCYRPFTHYAQRMAIGAIGAGPFVEGELIAATPSGAKGRLLDGAANGAAYLEYEPDGATSAASGDHVVGADSGASADFTGTVYQDPGGSLSIYAFGQGRRQAMDGARATGKMSFKVGEPCIFAVDLKGAYQSIGNQAPFSGVTYESTTPPVFLSAALTWGSYAARVASLELDLGGSLAEVQDANEAGGIAGYRVTDRKIKVTIDPEAVRTNVEDWWTKWLGATEAALSWRLGTVSGNMFEFYGKGFQIQNISEADREGVEVDQIELAVNLDRQDPGDDDLVILAL